MLSDLAGGRRHTTVVNINRDEYDVYIGRAMPGRGLKESVFANRHRIGPDGDRAEVIAKFRAEIIERLKRDPKLREELERLRGQRIGCHCKPKDCHGDILVELLEGPPEPEPSDPQQALF